jgi:hypothetical protein
VFLLGACAASILCSGGVQRVRQAQQQLRVVLSHAQQHVLEARIDVQALVAVLPGASCSAACCG